MLGLVFGLDRSFEWIGTFHGTDKRNLYITFSYQMFSDIVIDAISKTIILVLSVDNLKSTLRHELGWLLIALPE